MKITGQTFCVLSATFALLLKDEPVSGSQAMYELQKRLFSNYSSSVRPVANEEDQVYITVSMQFSYILEMDLRAQTLKSSGYMDMVWVDEMLVWEPEENANITEMLIPQTMVWRPDLVISNDVRQILYFGSERTLVQVRNDGRVTWQPDFLAETSCDVDVYKYPFDTQTCEITVLTWMTTSLYANISYLEVWAEDATVNDEFVLLNSSVYTVDFAVSYAQGSLPSPSQASLPSSSVGKTFIPIGHFVVVLQRRYMFYLLSTILPLAAFSLLPPLALVVPAETGEKITLSVTVLLSNLVFMGSLSDSIPRVSDKVCIFVAYATFQIILSFAAVIVVVIALVLSGLSREHEGHGGHDTVPAASSDSTATSEPKAGGRATSFLKKYFRWLFYAGLRYRQPAYSTPIEPSKHVKVVEGHPPPVHLGKEFDNIFTLSGDGSKPSDSHAAPAGRQGNSHRGQHLAKRRSIITKPEKVCFVLVFVLVVVVNIVTVVLLAL